MKYLSTVLSIAGSLGTVATGIFGVKAGMKLVDICSDGQKHSKKEIVKACAPALISCGVSIGCNVGSHIIDNSKNNELLALCALGGSSYASYRKEVIKRYGEEVDKEIVDTVAKHAEICCMFPDIPDKLSHWIVDMCDQNIPIFELDAYERDIIHAETHFNRNYILMGCSSFSDLLEFLEIQNEYEHITDEYGWVMDSGIYYVDFEHEKIDDYTFRILPIFSPEYQFYKEYY